MKKLIFAVILALLVLAALGTTVFADNGPHGGFSNTTSDCASCHRIHSAQSADGFLLVAHDVYATCISCHGDGVGAYTDVKNGVYTSTVTGGDLSADALLGTQGDAGQPLFGGGFESVAFDHTFNGMLGYDKTSTFPAPSAASSTHSVEGLGAANGSGTLWGSGVMSATLFTGDSLTGAAGSALECTSCHDPHGKAGMVSGVKTASYRLLRYTPNFSNGFDKALNTVPANIGFVEGVHMADISTPYWYTINSDYTKDNTVAVYYNRISSGAPTYWLTYITQRGDAAGRSYTYKRPSTPTTAFTAIAAGAIPSGAFYSCTMFDLPNPLLPQGDPSVTPGTFDYNTARDSSCATTTGTTFNNQAARAAVGSWCGTCHDRYAATSGARSNDSGDAHYAFRHTSASTTGSVTCVDCHAAHGTNAVMTNTNLEHPTASLTSGSILLKTDERSVCLKCHSQSINFTYSPTPVP